MTRKEMQRKLRALNQICLAYARRLYYSDNASTAEQYEKYKTERDALRKELYNV